MVSALSDGSVDLVVALTEGLITSIATGSDIKLIGTYVQSPLTWAISTGPNSAIREIGDLRGGRIGVSRLTSGSHLMSCVLASQRGWKQSELTYVIEGSFENLRNSVANNKTEAFMWETFTTKPYHDSGEVRRIGEIVTPWPCFMMAAREPVIAAKRDAIDAVLDGIQRACAIFSAGGAAMVDQVSQRYGLQLADAHAWYDRVRVVGSRHISEGMIDQTIQALKDAGILTASNYPRDLPLEHFVDSAVLLDDDIKCMKLYHRPELLIALWNNIRVRLGKPSGPLNFKDLLPFDQNSYGGVSALDETISLCHLTSSSRVIQLGSSVGGPSRYFAGTLGCEVLAVELQADLHGAARELTQRCGFEQKVHHLAGDFLDLARHLSPSSYDAITSSLTVLHFDKDARGDLFRHAHRLLRDGGLFFADDFFERGRLTPDERRSLRRDVFCKYLPSFDEYQAQLVAAGFEIAHVEDITASWSRATTARVDAFAQTREDHLAVHGEEVVKGLETFYAQIKKLFDGGNCGGIRIVARKATTPK